MDKAEATVAAKKIAGWPERWKLDVVQLTPHEREVLMTLVALVDARPADEEQRP